MSDPVTASILIGGLQLGSTVYQTEEQKKMGKQSRDEAKKQQNEQLALLETTKKESKIKEDAVSKRNQMLRAQNEIATNKTVLGAQTTTQAAPVKTMLGQ